MKELNDETKHYFKSLDRVADEIFQSSEGTLFKLLGGIFVGMAKNLQEIKMIHEEILDEVQAINLNTSTKH